MSRAPRLVSIAVSHYCEKARWALERAGIDFEEERHAPLLHMFATVPRTRRSVTPLFLVGDGERLQDSTAIVAWADRTLAPEARLFPDGAIGDEVRALEASFDRALGPATRRFAYHHVLADGPLFVRSVTFRVDAVERALLALFRVPISAAMRRGMRIDAAGAARSRDRIDAAFADVESLLRDGRPFLTGDRFTAADLTFAALGAPVVLPPAYPIEVQDDSVLPPAFRSAVDDYRARPAGAFILRVYREERARVVTTR